MATFLAWVLVIGMFLVFFGVLGASKSKLKGFFVAVVATFAWGVCIGVIRDAADPENAKKEKAESSAERSRTSSSSGGGSGSTESCGVFGCPDYVGVFEGSYHGPLTGDRIDGTLSVTLTSLRYESADFLGRSTYACNATFNKMKSDDFIVRASCGSEGGEFRWTGSEWDGTVGAGSVRLFRKSARAN